MLKKTLASTYSLSIHKKKSLSVPLLNVIEIQSIYWLVKSEKSNMLAPPQQVLEAE